MLPNAMNVNGSCQTICRQYNLMHYIFVMYGSKYMLIFTENISVSNSTY